MRVAAYVRVSTPGRVKLQPIDQQLETVHRYVRDEGWELRDENVVRDDGFSGASVNRPALDLLRDKARISELLEAGWDIRTLIVAGSVFGEQVTRPGTLRRCDPGSAFFPSLFSGLLS